VAHGLLQGPEGLLVQLDARVLGVSCDPRFARRGDKDTEDVDVEIVCKVRAGRQGEGNPMCGDTEFGFI
jgi:hypothetical protein